MTNLPLSEIVVGKRAAVEVAPNETIRVLAISIKSEGIKKPLVVRPVGKKYELVCGLKRIKAAMMNGMSSVPVEIKELTDKEAARLAFTDNLDSM